MPVKLSFIERSLLRLGVIPAAMVDFVQYPTIRLLVAAHRIGLLDELGRQPQSPEALSRALGADPAALEMLLDLLRRNGYLTLHWGRYALARTERPWLVEDSPRSLKGMIEFMDDMTGRWDRLEATIMGGRPPRTAYDDYREHPEGWPSFHEGQRTIAMLNAAEAARRVRLPHRPLRMIDVGGSHGLYSIALCRRYPRLSATIFDWPDGAAIGAREVGRAGLTDRIDTVIGDFTRDDLGTGYDVAFLGNIVHGQSPEVNGLILRRVRAALGEHGTIVLLDQVREGRYLLPLAGYTARLTGLILLNELGGAVYAFADIKRWLRDAGFGAARLHRLWRTPGFAVIQAWVSPPGQAPTRRSRRRSRTSS